MSQLDFRYATALFELAKETDSIDAWQGQMQSIRSVFVQNKDYISFFGHYRIANSSKKEVLRNVFQDKVDKNVLNFLLLLVDKKRIKHILGIATSFHSICNASKNIKQGIVYSVKELDINDKAKIEETVGKSLNCTVDLTNQIDRSLITGVKVVVEDQVIDGSLRNRMNSLKSELLKESR